MRAFYAGSRVICSGDRFQGKKDPKHNSGKVFFFIGFLQKSKQQVVIASSYLVVTAIHLVTVAIRLVTVLQVKKYFDIFSSGDVQASDPLVLISIEVCD